MQCLHGDKVFSEVMMTFVVSRNPYSHNNMLITLVFGANSY